MSTETKEVENKEQNQQSENDKIGKAYDANYKKLLALMRGPENLKKLKIPNDEVGDIVEEMFEEERKAIVDKFKVDAKATLQAKFKFDEECKAAEKQYKDTVNIKKKEFTVKMTDLFKALESIDKLTASYYASMKEVKDLTETPETPEAETTEEKK